MPWLAEEILGGQNQGMDIPAHARTAHSGLQQTALEENLLNRLSCLPTTQLVKGSELK